MKQPAIAGVLFWTIIFVVIITSVLSTTDMVTAVDSDTSATEAAIGNATPTIGVISRDASITLVENGYTAIAWATTTITDNNGCDEIDMATSVTALFYDDDAVNTDCSTSGRDCYVVASTTCAVTAGSCTGEGDSMVEWSCYTHPWHYANASAAWKWYIMATDTSAAGDADTSDAVTVNSLIALDVTEVNIPYGTLALNSLSTQATTTVLNTGNKSAMDVGIKESTQFDCAVGHITSTYQHYSQSGGFSYGDGTALTTSTVTLNADIVQGQNGSTAPSETIYWLLTTPTSGVSGECDGANYFEAQ